jgi:Flp pilus assembly protein TadD
VFDFNIVDQKGNYKTREVSDRYALALFYSNVGVDALLAGDYATSFVQLKAAIEAFPKIPGPWVNLGLLYARQGLHAQAEAAYLHALEADAGNRSALTNLASLYITIGDKQRADIYRERIRRYQERNPYYHYSRAQRAYESEQYRASLELLDVALRLKRDEHQFYFLQALAHYRLGERQQAERSLLRAKEHAHFAEIKARYEAGIETLAGS